MSNTNTNQNSWCKSYNKSICNLKNIADVYCATVGNTSWARTRNLRAPPFIATARNMAAHHARESVVIDMSDVSSPPEGKKPETLFGPSIGVVQTAPAWTDVPDKKSLADQLTPEDVKGWVNKSKDVRILF